MTLFEGKQEHPGWALRTKEGNWLAYAHGWHIATDAFYARIFTTELQATKALDDMQEDFVGGIECDIVPAWEPMCGKLRYELSLQKINKITPGDLTDVWFLLEEVKTRLGISASEDEEDEEEE